VACPLVRFTDQHHVWLQQTADYIPQCDKLRIKTKTEVLPAHSPHLLFQHWNDHLPAGTGRGGGTANEEVVMLARCLDCLRDRLHGAHQILVGEASVGQARSWHDEERRLCFDRLARVSGGAKPRTSLLHDL